MLIYILITSKKIFNNSIIFNNNIIDNSISQLMLNMFSSPHLTYHVHPE